MIISLNKERDLNVFERVIKGEKQAPIGRDLGLSAPRIGTIWQGVQRALMNPVILQNTVIKKPLGSPKTMREEAAAWLELVERARKIEE